METEEKTRSADRSIEEPVVMAEVAALIRYASERGIDPDGKVTGPLFQSVRNNQIDETVIRQYAQLVALVNNTAGSAEAGFEGINGRTLLDTEYCYVAKARPVLTWGLAFLFLALATGALDLWFKDIAVPKDGPLLYLINFHRYFLNSLSPFLWGATGASVFLLKRLSDRAADRCFDSQKWQGWGTRIILGAILGAITVVVYDVKAFTEHGLNVGANAVAFMAGLGVRVIYGAIEKTIDVLVEKFNLTSSPSAPSAEVRSTPSPPHTAAGSGKPQRAPQSEPVAAVPAKNAKTTAGG